MRWTWWHRFNFLVSVCCILLFVLRVLFIHWTNYFITNNTIKLIIIMKMVPNEVIRNFSKQIYSGEESNVCSVLMYIRSYPFIYFRKSVVAICCIWKWNRNGFSGSKKTIVLVRNYIFKEKFIILTFRFILKQFIRIVVHFTINSCKLF